MKRTRGILLLLAAAAGLAGPAAGQAGTQGGFVDQVLVNELLIEAIVVGLDGMPVPDLGREDFLVRTGERKLALHDAVYYSFTEPPPAAEPGAEPRPVESRKFILFFDVPRTALQATAFAQARRTVRAWIENDLLAADLVAVASRDTALELNLDFTRDRAAVAGWLVPGGTQGGPVAEAPDVPSLRTHLERTAAGRPDATLAGALLRLAEAGSHLPGRKNVILFSAGGEGAGDLEAARLALNSSNTAVYGFHLIGSRDWARTFERLCTGTMGAFFERFDTSRGQLQRVERELRGYYLLSLTPDPDHPLLLSEYRHLKVGARKAQLRVRALPSQRPLG